MTILSAIQAILISSFAAIPSSLLLLRLEGQSSIVVDVGWIGTSIAIYAVALLGSIFIGLPVHFIMQKMNMKGRLAYALSGFFSPLIIVVSVLIVQREWHELMNLEVFLYSLVFAIAAAAVALAWREVLNFLAS